MEKPRKSKVEIIDETIEYIKENGRAVDEDNNIACVYQTPDGRGCAVGRCMDKRKYFKEMEENNIYSLCKHVLENSLDEYLKKDYRGHSIEFWGDLQELHDDKSYWDLAHGKLSSAGKRKVELLKKIYS